MKITINNNTVILLSKAKQSHNYILNNYFKFLFQKYFLHLVKTFLTSITFDSLSERNLCLVIKKFYSKGVCKMKHTKNILKSLLITVMALPLLAVSCKNDDKTGSSGYSVPKATGDKATDLTAQAEYSGTLNRTAHEGSDTGLTSMEFQLFIENNKVKGGALGAFAGADFTGTQVYKSGSEYSAYSSYNATDTDVSYVDEGNVKEYIKFTISGDTINVIEYIASTTYGGGYKDTYSVTLTRTTSAGS